MQLEDAKTRHFDLNLSMTKDSSPTYDARRDGEVEFIKKRNSDLESQVKSLKEELHSAKVEREKYHDKYELATEDNRMLKDQIFSLKKLLLEVEKKDYSLAHKLQSIESMRYLQDQAAHEKREKQRESTKQADNKNSESKRPENSHPAPITDDRPIKPAKSNLTPADNKKNSEEKASNLRGAADYKSEMFSSKNVVFV